MPEIIEGPLTRSLLTTVSTPTVGSTSILTQDGEVIWAQIVGQSFGINALRSRLEVTTWRCKEMDWSIHISMGWMNTETATPTVGSTALLTEGATPVYGSDEMDAEGVAPTGLLTVPTRKLSLVVGTHV